MKSGFCSTLNQLFWNNHTIKKVILKWLLHRQYISMLFLVLRNTMVCVYGNYSVPLKYIKTPLYHYLIQSQYFLNAQLFFIKTLTFFNNVNKDYFSKQIHLHVSEDSDIPDHTDTSTNTENYAQNERRNHIKYQKCFKNKQLTLNAACSVLIDDYRISVFCLPRWFQTAQNTSTDNTWIKKPKKTKTNRQKQNK